MRHLDLFSGIGGFALAARWMNWETVQFVEIEPFCQAVLKKNFKDVPIHGDIKTFDGTRYRGAIDILTGGFPCQPFSNAGKRKGKDDDRYLWPEMLRVIREIQPSFIVGENVYGFVNWSAGLVFDEVQTSLENEGYEVTPVILPACGIDAPHRRDRVWILAYSDAAWQWRNKRKGETETDVSDSDSNGRFKCAATPKDNSRRIQKRLDKGHEPNPSSGVWIDPNNKNKRLQRGAINGSVSAIRQESGQLTAGLFQPAWENFPTQSPICGRDDGISNRMDRIKSLGNAIVPGIAFEIFKAIEATMK